MDDTFLSTVGLEADVPSSRMASDMAQIYPESFAAQCQSRSVIANGPPLANGSFRGEWHGGQSRHRGLGSTLFGAVGRHGGLDPQHAEE